MTLKKYCRRVIVFQESIGTQQNCVPRDVQAFTVPGSPFHFSR
jgi:hypothetical protein